MLSSYLPLGLLAASSAIVAATPVKDVYLKAAIYRRQDVEGEDIETEAATDQLRNAIDYASLFSAQPTVTYSAVSTGAAASDAALVSTTTIASGNNAVGSPPDKSEQGDKYVVDHILELQFAVGAFQINSKPDDIPADKWTSASNACFSKTKNWAPQTSVASAFSNTFNLQGIPSRFNGFKQQVFTGRLKSQPGNPSGNTYPSDFGGALKQYLEDNQQDIYSIMDSVGKVLGSENVGNDSHIQPYFASYAQGEYTSAIDFLGTWVGTTYTAGSASAATATGTGVITPTSVPATTTKAPASSTVAPSTTPAPVSSTPPPPPPPSSTPPPPPPPVCSPGFYGTDTSCGGKCNGDSASCDCVEAGYLVFNNACTCTC